MDKDNRIENIYLYEIRDNDFLLNINRYLKKDKKPKQVYKKKKKKLKSKTMYNITLPLVIRFWKQVRNNVYAQIS